MRTQVICTVPLALIALGAEAGSLLGADLQYEHVEGLTWAFKVVTYVDPFAPADMPELFVMIDGAADTIPRESQTMIYGDCFMQVAQDIYIWQHTFPGPGDYDLMAWKTGRVETVNLPTGMNQPLCLSTEIHIIAGVVNSSPVFGTPQRTSYYLGDVFVHDPQLTDPDGDSFICWMVFPRGTDCMMIVQYYDPEQTTPLGDTITLDHATGVFRWFHPNTSGTFTVVIGCIELRDGVVIGQVTRDMTICIEEPFTGVTDVPGVSPMVRQGLDGVVTLTNVDRSPLIEIHDAHGALVERLRNSGTTTVLDTEALMPGIYLVSIVDPAYTTAAGRFIVTR